MESVLCPITANLWANQRSLVKPDCIGILNLSQSYRWVPLHALLVWVTKSVTERDVCIHGNKVHCSDCVSGTNAYTPPEYISTARYDGCQGTVWQVGILLVEILSPYMPFDKPEHALKMGPRIPEQLSSGDKLKCFYNFSLYTEFAIWMVIILAATHDVFRGLK